MVNSKHRFVHGLPNPNFVSNQQQGNEKSKQQIKKEKKRKKKEEQQIQDKIRGTMEYGETSFEQKEWMKLHKNQFSPESEKHNEFAQMQRQISIGSYQVAESLKDAHFDQKFSSNGSQNRKISVFSPDRKVTRKHTTKDQEYRIDGLFEEMPQPL